MARFFTLAMLAALTGLAACSSAGSGPPAGGSAMIGSFAGGSASGRGGAADPITGAMGGGLLGNGIGTALSDGDRRRALEAEYRALEYMQRGETVMWTGARGNLRGEVVAYQPYRVGSQDCRQYVHTVHAGGEPQVVRGTACRNPDGSWTPVV